MSATTDFPHTISGWIVLILPFGIGAVGWLVVRVTKGFDELKASQVELLRTTAVLASEFHTVQVATGKNTDEITDLKTATAVLKEQNDRHETWAQREHERLMSHLEHA